MLLRTYLFYVLEGLLRLTDQLLYNLYRSLELLLVLLGRLY